MAIFNSYVKLPEGISVTTKHWKSPPYGPDGFSWHFPRKCGLGINTPKAPSWEILALRQINKRYRWYLYPLVMTNITIEHGHWNSEFSHWKWWFSIVFCLFTREYLVILWLPTSRRNKTPSKKVFSPRNHESRPVRYQQTYSFELNPVDGDIMHKTGEARWS